MRLALLAATTVVLSPIVLMAAAPPSESLLPATTKAFVSAPDVDALREAWDATDVGRLAADPLMQPFMDDLKKQFEARLSLTGNEFGITWDDLKDVYAGETALGIVQVRGNPAQDAAILVCDVTGRSAEAQALVAKLTNHLKQQGATATSQNVAGVAVSVFVLPKKEGRPADRKAALAIAQDVLIVSDHVQETADLIARIQKPSQATLQQVPAFRFAMDRVAREAGDVQPHLRWFVEPFGLADVIRNNETERRKGIDYLKIFREQGFDAIQGAGGYVQMKTGEHEFLHRTFVYVPAQNPSQLVSAANFKEAARMLDFPNAQLKTPDWLPRDLASSITYSWKMKESFEYSKTLINAIAEDPIFEDVIQSFRDDPEGPQIDLRKDLVAHLGEQITIASDYRLPITTESERLMVAIELSNPQAVANAVNKAMARDPDVRKIQFGEHIIWEILDPTDNSPSVITLKIDGPGFGAFGNDLHTASLRQDEEEEKPAFPNSAVTVAFGRLIWTSHVDFAKDLLTARPPSETLVASADFQAVNAALEKLGAGENSFRYFSRSDESLRPTYELMQQGKMPEARTMLGRILNRLFQDEEDELLRKQEIDAKKLPDYQIVRRHLGPSGIYIRTEANGWLAVGCGLSKRAP
jgi:hypothetical protein